MKALLSLVIVGCGLTMPGFAAFKKAQQNAAAVSARVEKEANTCILMKKDEECKCPSKLMEKRRGVYECLFEYCHSNCQQPSSVWSDIVCAKQKKCGSYTFVHYAKQSAQDVCGALGMVPADRCGVSAHLLSCARKHGYKQHGKPCKKDKRCKKCPSSTSSTSCSDEYSEDSCSSTKSSSSDSDCSKSSDSSTECSSKTKDTGCCPDVTCEWKQKGECVVLCSKHECKGCGETKLLTFDDCKSETCDALFPDGTGLNTTYHGFHVTNGGVYDPWANRCDFENQCAFPSDITAVISGRNILMSSQPTEPMAIWRKKEFGLVSVFVTLSSMKECKADLKVTAFRSKKELCTERVSLRTGCPVCFRPKSAEFSKINKVRFEWDVPCNQLEGMHLDIDNMLVCM